MEQHRYALDIAPYALSISPLDCEALDLLIGFDFNYRGNHNELIAEALGICPAMEPLTGMPGATIISNEPNITVALDDECRLQCRLSIEPRTNAYQIRTGEYLEEQISVYVTARQYGSLAANQTYLETLDRLYDVAKDMLDNYVVDSVLQPLARDDRNGVILPPKEYSVPGSAWDRTALEAPPQQKTGRACRTVGSQAGAWEPGKTVAGTSSSPLRDGQPATSLPQQFRRISIPMQANAPSNSVLGSGIATRLETKTPLVPSVNLAENANWPKLLKPLGRPSPLPVPASSEKLRLLIVRKSVPGPSSTSSRSPSRAISVKTPA